MGGIQSSTNQQLERTLGNNFPDGIKFVGFENRGNICYANATIQCMFYCEQFREKVLKAKSVDGVKNDMFKGDYHQDCHEFLNWYLNEIDDVLKKEKKNKYKNKEDVPNPNLNPTNWLQEIFQGKAISRTECQKCKNVTERKEPFFDLSVDLQSNTSLTYCLQQMSQPEILNGKDQFRCDKCEDLQDATKKYLIEEFPKTLIIHLKRFKYDENYKRMIKVNTKVAFPFEIKLKPNDREDRQEQMYQLYGIVIHLGQGEQYGHYVSIIKIKNLWYLFDDETIINYNERDIRDFFGSNHRSACAYMLFYEKLNQSQQ
ncbi:hypothetical protein PPERSA_00834 [Pseudocohnilembus persalinus]|uniref:ubiquitinyl hydrolase 1 n=1 Tax=Pseudocohnilembus persalinus TaxID=266149 RepID=A0A0V0R7A9_PSEPJ|nr:hypothetical protein PPERSA_00834 [Pseudocohnilembus persalinus]|eukprot:KRX10354.1 hypothetical protein PPERSA_00834 [Pseudocohnilembus persalinus]